MSQTKQQWEAAVIRKYGSVEAGKEEMKRRRSLAANHGGLGGFTHMKEHDPERLREISKKANEARWKERHDVLPED